MYDGMTVDWAWVEGFFCIALHHGWTALVAN